MLYKVLDVVSIPKNWKRFCDLLKFKKEFNNWNISAFDYDPTVWFILEFNLQLSGWGSYNLEEKDNYVLVSYERTVASLVLFRTKIFQITKKWTEIKVK
jgi:hypothetical protein